MPTARKRPRPDEDLQAECPFTVTLPKPQEVHKNFKRRRERSEDQPTPKIPHQASPFTPLGKFKDRKHSLGRYYQVQPYHRWMDMSKYNSFVLNGVKYFCDGFIFVANSSTIERQNKPPESGNSNQKSEDDWVARILEIRASDEHHVYARVYWMYRPDEIPAGTQEGKKHIQGRQPYHGQNELIASNHMDVINVVSVTGQATVNQWDESNEDEVQDALYWRQAFDVVTMEISSAQPRCKCSRPENPDRQMISCTNSECKEWLHEDCLIHEALMKTFARLGTDRPHMSQRGQNGESENGRRQPSPGEPGVAKSAQQSSYAEPNGQDAVELGEAAKLEEVNGASGTPKMARSDSKRKARPRKPYTHGLSKNKPYDGLFSAQVNNSVQPSIEIRDLRENLTSGDKVWTEPIHCLLCDTVIH
ncbi:hypothetical protein F5Y17DRAFT_422111 [Xylariaceae sp. FL0594]|nr:hypothetical protein F5Y17DRAFT_422111 [Xylariaceae sp. FL0594]